MLAGEARTSVGPRMATGCFGNVRAMRVCGNTLWVEQREQRVFHECC